MKNISKSKMKSIQGSGEGALCFFIPFITVLDFGMGSYRLGPDLVIIDHCWNS